MPDRKTINQTNRPDRKLHCSISLSIYLVITTEKSSAAQNIPVAIESALRKISLRRVDILAFYDHAFEKDTSLLILSLRKPSTYGEADYGGNGTLGMSVVLITALKGGSGSVALNGDPTYCTTTCLIPHPRYYIPHGL